MRDRHGACTVVQGRSSRGSPQTALDFRHIRHKRRRDIFAGDARSPFPRQAGVRQGGAVNQVLRCWGNSLDFTRPRPPGRVRRARRLSGQPPIDLVIATPIQLLY